MIFKRGYMISTLQNKNSENIWMEAIPSPIHIFCVEEFGISLEIFKTEMPQLFHNLPWDLYDARREQIEFLQKHLALLHSENKLFSDYFTGAVSFDSIAFLYNMLRPEQKMEFDKIKPFRKRAISRFICELSEDQWKFERIKVPSFSQEAAKINEVKFDFRQLPRTFTEIESHYVNHPIFTKLLTGVAKKVHHFNPGVSRLDITAHHVSVETSIDRVKGNSPEGIHQDGYDYIVSALVVERDNVIGGESAIYGDDRETEILTTTLMPGFGILQPDKNTKLWHKVSPIRVKSKEKGYRSSIGFDIALMRGN